MGALDILNWDWDMNWSYTFHHVNDILGWSAVPGYLWIIDNGSEQKKTIDTNWSFTCCYCKGSSWMNSVPWSSGICDYGNKQKDKPEF